MGESEYEGEVCVEVLNDVPMEIEHPLSIDLKREHECLVVNGMVSKPCNSTDLVVCVEVLSDGAVDIENPTRVESKRELDCVLDSTLTQPWPKRQAIEFVGHEVEVMNDSELVHCIEEHAKGEVKLEEGLNGNNLLKEASNDDIFSEVSNPNLSPSPRDITSKFEPVGPTIGGSGSGSTRSGNLSAEESFSEEENLSTESKSCVVLEIPKHVCTTGIRKITLKFSKRKEDYDKVNSTPSSSILGDVNSQNSLVHSDNTNIEANSCIHEQRIYESNEPNMELNMPKNVMADSHISNVKKLLSTRILEGAHVKYIPTTGGIEISGIVKDCGYLCGCPVCNFSKVVSAYEFELHAGVKTRHPNNHIYLENGKPIYNIIQELKVAPLNKLEEVIKSVAGSSINEECFQIWKANNHHRNEIATADQSYYNKPVGNYHLISRARTFPYTAPVEHKRASEGGAKKRDNDLHRLLFMPNGLPDGTDLGYYSRGKKILGGYKQGNGIVCNCCHSEISPSQFEAHAGWAAKRQPYRHIYTSTGITLHDIAVMLANGQNLTSTHSDDMCAACGDSGELLICDMCPRAFHPDCLGSECESMNEWICPYCRDKPMVSRESGESRPIIIRLKRVVTAPEYEPGGCVVCRLQDFSVAQFDDRTVIICDQCEKEYHVGCLRGVGLCDLEELPKDKWFCCHDCNKIYSILQNYTLGGPDPIPMQISNTIFVKQAERGVYLEHGNNDMCWRILNGKSRISEHLPLLSSAAAIFRECFDPIVAKSGRDLIPVMVYGRNISGQEFGGMYCIVLIVKSVVVSACLLRIFGREVAELPLVATSRGNQGKGYFQALFGCIEKLLYSMNVTTLVLPAAEEAESIWTKKFGFRKISNDRMSRYRNFQLTVFKGTSMLEKEVLPMYF